MRDGFAAVRYVRANAGRLGVDPARLAAGGGSAGAHLAAATATLTADWTGGPPDAPDADPNAAVDARPDALVLFSPVYDNGPGGYGQDRVGDRYPEFSPLHNLREGTPPTLVALGTDDSFVPVPTARQWQRRQRELGARSDLELFDGAPHPFFNDSFEGGRNFARCAALVDDFLVSLGWLSPPP